MGLFPSEFFHFSGAITDEAEAEKALKVTAATLRDSSEDFFPAAEKLKLDGMAVQESFELIREVICSPWRSNKNLEWLLFCKNCPATRKKTALGVLGSVNLTVGLISPARVKFRGPISVYSLKFVSGSNLLPMVWFQ